MYALRSVGVHVVLVALWRRLVVRGGYWFVRLVLGRGVGGDTGGQVAFFAGGSATLARSGASSSSFDSFYYFDIIPCNFSKCIVRNFIHTGRLS